MIFAIRNLYNGRHIGTDGNTFRVPLARVETKEMAGEKSRRLLVSGFHPRRDCKRIEFGAECGTLGDRILVLLSSRNADYCSRFTLRSGS